MREGERKGEGGRERGSERVSVCVWGGGRRGEGIPLHTEYKD